MFEKILILITGFILKHLHNSRILKNNIWVFGGQNGDGFSDNSKYLFKYILLQQPEVTPVWLTRSSAVIKQLRAENIKVYHNFSPRGIWNAQVASVCVFCTSRGDLWFTYPAKNRLFVNLFHGMPMKKIAFDYPPHRPENRSMVDHVWSKYSVGFQHKDVSLIISTSSFFSRLLKSAFRNDRVIVTGQPRTDVFSNLDRTLIKSKYGLKDEDRIVTYMPTHRAYGKGKPNPLIFNNSTKAIALLRSEKIKVVWKFHPNMISKYKSSSADAVSDVFVDLTLKSVDPQELLFITDVLITDYSSCYVDFLLLKRPIIFYHYDNYEDEDNELYYKPEDHDVGCIATTETQLLDMVINCQPKRNVKVEYHEFEDDNSSKRVFNEITNL